MKRATPTIQDLDAFEIETESVAVSAPDLGMYLDDTRAILTLARVGLAAINDADHLAVHSCGLVMEVAKARAYFDGDSDA